MKLRFFTVVASSLVAGNSLQATDVMSPHEDSKRYPPSHYSSPQYGSSSNDFSDPHPGQEGKVHLASIPNEEYVLDMERLWEGMTTTHITSDDAQILFSSLRPQQKFQDHLLSDLVIEAYKKKLMHVSNFRTNNIDLLRQATNEISVNAVRKLQKKPPQTKYIPALQEALSEQISICKELMEIPYCKNSLMIQSNLTEVLITFYRFERNRLKRKELYDQINTNLGLLESIETSQKNPVGLHATHSELVEKFDALNLNKKTT